MTTIAWDGKTLAGDRQRSFNSTPLPVTKVFRLGQPTMIGNVPQVVLMGCAGHSPSAIALQRFAQEGGAKPTIKELDILLVDMVGDCWTGCNEMEFFRVELPHWSIGSGADYALGAMASGKSAGEAVDIASIYDTNTGMGVDVLPLVVA